MTIHRQVPPSMDCDTKPLLQLLLRSLRAWHSSKEFLDQVKSIDSKGEELSHRVLPIPKPHAEWCRAGRGYNPLMYNIAMNSKYRGGFHGGQSASHCMGVGPWRNRRNLSGSPCIKSGLDSCTVELVL